MKRTDEAVDIANTIIHQTDPDDSVTLARGIQHSWKRHAATRQDQGSLLAFLRVDLLYYSVPDRTCRGIIQLSLSLGAIEQNRSGRARPGKSWTSNTKQPLGQKGGR